MRCDEHWFFFMAFTGLDKAQYFTLRVAEAVLYMALGYGLGAAT